MRHDFHVGLQGDLALARRPRTFYFAAMNAQEPASPQAGSGDAIPRQAAESLVRDFGAAEVWLFGSAARGQTSEHSDIDLLVVREARPDCPRPGVEARLCLARRNLRRPFDLLVVTPERWQQVKARPFGVFEDILAHGQQLYARRSG